MKSKKHYITSGAIYNDKPISRKKHVQSVKTVEDMMIDVGKCCGVDECNGRIRHRDSATNVIEAYAVISGVFQRVDDPGSPRNPKYVVDNSIKFRDSDSPTGQSSYKYVEQVLDKMSDCCGVDCCGSNMMRLPNFSEGVIYEFGYENGSEVIRTVDGVTPTYLKKRFQVTPMDIYKPKARKPRVNYFEDVLQSMVDCGYFGFDCCEGRIILPGFAANGTDLDGSIYEVRVVAGAFVTSVLGTANDPIATGEITTAGGDDVTPAVGTLGGFFEAGETLTIDITHSASGALTYTYIVPVGGQSASQVAVSAAAGADAALDPDVAVSASGVTIEFLTETNPDTLTLTTFSVTNN